LSSDGRALLAPAFTLVSCLAYSSTLKMEATCSSSTSVVFQRTVPACHLRSRWFLAWLILRPWRWRRYIPDDRTLHNHDCESPSSYIVYKVLFLFYSALSWLGHAAP
jgi:hypothetical protein